MLDGVSVIVPALNEGGRIETTLQSLQPLREHGGEVIVIDGCSSDDTGARARPLADRVLSSSPGRALQMNAGAAAARGELLWFLHADTGVDPMALHDLDHLDWQQGPVWGRFGIRLSGDRPLFRLIAALVNLRSRLTGIATGDQGIFVQRHLFEAAGRFPEIPLMEDVALTRQLRRRARPLCLPVRLTTSSRRWESGGAWRTIFLMWSLRWAYWRGADPGVLATRYRQGGGIG